MGECFSEDHDCIVVYARRAEVWRPALLKRSEEALERYETGEEFDEGKVDEARGFIGESRNCRIYLLHVPDVEKLKNLALTLDWAKGLGAAKGKHRLVFAPTKYLDQDHLDKFPIDYAQLPYEIYGLVR